MEEELVVIAVFAIIFSSVTVISIARSISKAIQAKSRRGDEGGGSLTKGELQRLLREAVEEATLPLYTKIDGLERKLDRVSLPPAERPAPSQLEAHREID